MICVIFCGGFGTRMNNGNPGQLKPLIKVAGKEILEHIISIYSAQNIKEFILLGGYKIEELQSFVEKFAETEIKVEVLDTGEGTPTGGRLLHLKERMSDNDFLLTYGDSVTNFNLTKALEKMLSNNAQMSISTFYKTLEYGVLRFNEDSILKEIKEKTYSVPINAGFYILNNSIFKYIFTYQDSFEVDVLPKILKDKKTKLSVYNVDFWHPMDTPTDLKSLEKILQQNPDILYK